MCDDDDGGGDVLGPELPPSTLAESEKERLGRQKRGLRLRPRIEPEDPQTEPGSGL